jgi:arginyl-tRNA synthetase
LFSFFAFIESSVVFLQAARMAGWLPDPSEKRFLKTSQVGFGLVLGSDGKQF